MSAGTALIAVVALLVALLVALRLREVLHRVARWLRTCWKARRIPGPPGGLLFFAGRLDGLLDRAKLAQRKYGNTVRVWALPVVNITVCEPEDLEVLFNSPHLQNKPRSVYDLMAPIMGLGLVTLDGDTHRRHRKAISPSLHLQVLQDFMPAFERNALKLCGKLEYWACTGEVFDAYPLLGSYSAHAICETVFSIEAEPNLGVEESDNFIKYLLASSPLMYERVRKPWFRWDFLFYFSSFYEEYQRCAKAFESYSSKMLFSKVDKLKRGHPQGERRRKAFLDHLLEGQSQGQAALTDTELIEELKTMSAAAVGTSTDFMSVFLIVLGMLQDVQDKIAKELDDVFGGSLRPVEPEDLSHLQYLECVIKETMRMFPPVFSFSRAVLQDVALPSGHVLPQGSVVAVLPYFTHRNPRHFADPDKFDPSRFLPENSRGRHPYAYVPFSAGTRNCIGQRYALMSAKIVTSSILRRFRVLPSPDGPQTLGDVKLTAGISMSPSGGCNVRVVRKTSIE